jgi:hypothetical protein
LFFGVQFAEYLGDAESDDEDISWLEFCALIGGYGFDVGGSDAVAAEGGVLDAFVVSVGFVVD